MSRSGPAAGQDARAGERRVADARLLLPALAAWAILAAALGCPPVVLAALALGAAAAAAAAWCLRRRVGAAAAVALGALVTALVLVAAAGHGASRGAGPVAGLARDGARVAVVGVVDGDPRPTLARGPGGGEQYVVPLLVEEVVARGEVSRVRTPVLLVGGGELRSVRWWERVRLSGRLRPAEPGEDVSALLVGARGVERLERAGPGARVAEFVRDRFREAVDPLPADARGLVPALVIGDRSLTPPELTQAMRDTGMTHLSAVSGSNVALMLGAVVILCRGLGLPRRLRPLLAGLALAGFVVLARPEPSVIRAAVMGAIGLLGLSSSRRAAGPPALAGAVVVLLVVDPWLARSYGFALSVLATLGLLVLARPWGRAIARILPPRLGALGEAIAIPVAAQVACAPVLVLLQGSVTLVGVLANLLAAPLVGPATIAGIVAALASAAWPPLGTLVAWAAALPAAGIAVVARVCARVPGGTLPWPDGAVGAVLLAVPTLVLLLAGRRVLRAVGAHPLPAAALVLLAVAAVWPVGPTIEGPWRFAACDVGQGDALLVATGPGRGVLVDAGPEPEAVDRCLSELGVQALDAVVLTHYDGDHVGGLAGAVRGREVGALYTSPVTQPRAGAEAVRRIAGERGLDPTPLVAGDVVTAGDLVATLRSPAPSVGGDEPNVGSLVLDVRCPELRMLLLADADRGVASRVRRELEAEGATAGIDVLKVAHHGSSDTDPDLLEEVAAPVAVVSVGADNDYGHPTPRTLEALGRAGSSVARTDESGTVLVGRRDDGQLVLSTADR